MKEFFISEKLGYRTVYRYINLKYLLRIYRYR